MNLRSLSALGAALIALAFAGCGSSNKSSSSTAASTSGPSAAVTNATTTPPGTTQAAPATTTQAASASLSKSAFQSKINAICKKYLKKTNALAPPKSIDEVAPFATKGVALETQQVAELQSVDAQVPAASKAQFEKALALLKQEEGVLSKLIPAAQAKDTKQIQSIVQEGNTLSAKANAIASKLGLGECTKS